MIKGTLTMALDGNFRKEFPEHEAFSLRIGGEWYVARRGPRYVNQYKVAETDAAGQQWLEANERKPEADDA